MHEIRNSQGKLVCRMDKQRKTIEIAVKGCVTHISFSDDGNIKVEHVNRDILYRKV